MLFVLLEVYVKLGVLTTVASLGSLGVWVLHEKYVVANLERRREV